MSQGEGKMYPAPTRRRTKELDAKLERLQKSTRGSFGVLVGPHDLLRQKFRWYYNWHMNNWANFVHWLVLGGYTVAAFVLVFTLVVKGPAHQAQAASKQVWATAADWKNWELNNIQITDAGLRLAALPVQVVQGISYKLAQATPEPTLVPVDAPASPTPSASNTVTPAPSISASLEVSPTPFETNPQIQPTAPPITEPIVSPSDSPLLFPTISPSTSPLLGQTEYKTSGSATLTFNPKKGEIVDWLKAESSVDLNGGSVKFEFSTDNILWTTDAKKLANSDTAYLKITLSTSDSFSTPVVSNFTMNYSRLPLAPKDLKANQKNGILGGTQILSAGLFSDPDGDLHEASQWQITNQAGVYTSTIEDSGINKKDLTSYTTTRELKEGDYYFRVRYQDSVGAWSPWSQECAFSVGKYEIKTIGEGQLKKYKNEIVSDRTETTKTLNEGNGKRTLLSYSGLAHYKDDYNNDKATWKDINPNHYIDFPDFVLYDQMPSTVKVYKNKIGYEIQSRQTGEKYTVELQDVDGTPKLSTEKGADGLVAWADINNQTVIQAKAQNKFLAKFINPVLAQTPDSSPSVVPTPIVTAESLITPTVSPSVSPSTTTVSAPAAADATQISTNLNSIQAPLDANLKFEFEISEYGVRLWKTIEGADAPKNFQWKVTKTGTGDLLKFRDKPDAFEVDNGQVQADQKVTIEAKKISGTTNNFVWQETAPTSDLKIDTDVTYYVKPYNTPGVNTVDGVILQGCRRAVTWAELHSASAVGNGGSDSYLQVLDGSSTYQGMLLQSYTVGTWCSLYRSFFTFNTSSIPDSATITGATLSVYGGSAYDNIGITPEMNLNVFSASTANDAYLNTSDYTSVGSTPFATAIPMSSWTYGYNDFVFNSNGHSAIVKNGISKFSLLNGNYDGANVEPTATNGSALAQFDMYYAETDGTSQDPKLAVSYTGGQTVSGTIYSNTDFATPLGADIPISVTSNGGDKISGVTGAGGTFSISGVEITAGKPVTVFVDNDQVNNYHASLVSVPYSANDLTGLKLANYNTVLRNESGVSAITGADLTIAASCGCLPDFSTDSTTIYGQSFYIPTGMTFTPGLNMGAYSSLVVAGTVNMGSNNLGSNNSSTVGLTMNTGGVLNAGSGTHYIYWPTFNDGTFNAQTSNTTFSGSFYFYGGTFNGGSATLGFYNSSFYQMGGTFNSTSGVLTVSKDDQYNNFEWNVSAGTWNHGSGTVKFGNINPSQSNAPYKLTAVQDFYNVIGDNSAGGYVQDDAAITVLNDLTVTTGSLSFGTIAVKNDLTIANGAYFYSPTLTLSGNLTNLNTSPMSMGGLTFDNVAKTSNIYGNNIFDSFTCVTAGKTLAFEAAKTQTVNAYWDVEGGVGSNVTLKLIGTASSGQWSIYPNYYNMQQWTVDRVTYSDSINLNPRPIAPTNSTASGTNNVNWTGYHVSGTAYQWIGGSNVGSGQNISISVNGGAKQTMQTDANGAFDFVVGGVNTGVPIIIFFEDGNYSYGNTVTIAASQNDVSGLALYPYTVTMTYENSGPMTNAVLAVADNLADPKIIYSMDGSNNLTTSFTTYVPAGKVYSPGAGVTTSGVNISGTLNAASSFISDGMSNFSIPTGGIFNAGTGTVTIGSLSLDGGTFNGQTSTLTLNGYSGSVNSGTFNSNTATVTIKIYYSFTITGGTFHAPAGTLTLDGNGDGTDKYWVATAGTFVHHSGKVLFTNLANNYNYFVSSVPAFYDLTADSVYGTVKTNSAISIENNLEISGANTFASPLNELTVKNFIQSAGNFASPETNNNGFKFLVSGNFDRRGTSTFTHNWGTVEFNGAAGTTQKVYGDTTFWNLYAHTTAARTINFESGSNQTVQGTWTATGIADNLLTLGREGGADLDQWEITPTVDMGNQWDVNYVDASNSKNNATSGGNPVAINPSVLDHGNNLTNWFIAAACTWDGDAAVSSADYNWSTPENWGNDTVPDANCDVKFTSTYQQNSIVDAGFTNHIKSLTIDTGHTGLVTAATNLNIDNAFNFKDGTFNAGTGTITATDLYQSGGIYNANSSTLNIAEFFALSGGTFNGGTSTFNISRLSSNYFWIHGGTFNADLANLNISSSSISVDAGTFNGQTSTVILTNSTFIIGGTGAFNAPSGTMTINITQGVYPYLDFSTGTFNHNDGKVVINYSGSSAFKINSNGKHFYDLTVNSTSNGSIRTEDDALNVDHNFVILDGQFANYNTLTVANMNISTDASLWTSGYNVSISGDLLVNGAYFQNGGGATTLAGLAGTTQSVSGTGTFDFYNLMIDADLARTISFAPGVNITASGLLTATGAVDQYLTLTGTDTWTVTPTSWLIDYVNVVNSTNAALTKINPLHYSPASLKANNVNWFSDYVITSTVNGANGTISPLGDTIIADGADQGYTITPDDGYAISEISIDGTPVSGNLLGSYTFTNVTANHTIDVTFVLGHNISVGYSGNGTVTPSGGMVADGGQITFTMTPNQGYAIIDVKVDNVSVPGPYSSTYSLSNVTTDHTFYVTFGSNATCTWDGGGSDNNWSTAANWVGDIVPNSTCEVIFDGTSTKDAVINGIVNIDSLSVNTGYTGTITAANFSDSLSIAKDFSLNSGTFSPHDKVISIGGSLYIAPSPTAVYENNDSRFSFTGSRETNTITTNGQALGSVSIDGQLVTSHRAYLYPTSDHSTTLSNSENGAHYASVDEITPINDNDYIYAQLGSGGQDLFGHNNPTFGVGTTINSVTVYARTMANATLEAIEINGQPYYGDIHVTANAYQLNHTTWRNNPSTGLAWTTQDISDLYFGVVVNGVTTARASQVYAVVDYSYATTADYYASWSVTDSLSASSLTINQGNLYASAGVGYFSQNNGGFYGNLSVGADFTRNGGIYEGSLTLSGSGTQVISGETTFTDLTMQNTEARTIQFEGGKTQTVTGTWTAGNSGDASKLLTLERKTGTSGVWSINPTAWSVDYVDVTNSTNLASAPIDPTHYSLATADPASNNTNWLTPVVTHTINSSVIGSNGTISPLGDTLVNAGADQAYIITPDQDYEIAGISIDGTPLSAPFTSPYTFTNVTGDHTIVVSFALIATVPATPTTVTITPTSPTGFDVTWTDVATETGYKIYTAAGNANCANATYDDQNPDYTVAADVTSQSNTYKGINTEYCAKVVAFNLTGDSLPGYAEPKYTLANVPGSPVLSDVASGSIKTTIDQNINPDLNTTYAIKVVYGANTKWLNYATGTLSDTEVWGTYTNFAGASGVTNTGLAPNTLYTYSVAAKNGNSVETAYSATASETTLISTTCTWDGGATGGGDYNWSTAANWTNDTVPDENCDVVFDVTSNTDSEIDINFLTSIKSLTVTSDYTGTIVTSTADYLIVDNNVTLSGGTLAVNLLSVGGNFTNNASASFLSADLFVTGNFTNNGTFEATTTTFENAGTSIISGNTTFDNFTCQTPGKTLSFAALSVQTVTGTWFIQGDGTANVNLARAGGSGSEQWTINPTVAVVDYVDVANSNNTNGGYIDPTNPSAASLLPAANNSMWFSPSVPLAPTNVSMTPTSATSFRVNWTDVPEADLGYEIYVAPGTDDCATANYDQNPATQAQAGESLANVLLQEVDTRYCAAVVGLNATGPSDPGFVAEAKYTFANTPGAPTVSAGATPASSLHVKINATNPVQIEYAIKVVRAGTDTKYVNTSGTLSPTPVWGVYSAFGGDLGLDNTGLMPNTQYVYSVEARNSEQVTTEFGQTANGTTGDGVLATCTWDGDAARDSQDYDWSNVLNWSGDVLPTTTCDVTFNSLSSENSVVDSGFSVNIQSLSMNTGYTGTLTLSNDLSITGDATLASGTIDGSAAHNTFNIGGAWNNTGTTFATNKPSVNFNGSGVSKNITTNGQTFYNMTIDGQAGGATGSVTVRPISDGFITLNNGIGGNNYAQVAETSPDDMGSYVYTDTSGYDLYGASNHNIPVGSTIDSITVYTRSYHVTTTPLIAVGGRGWVAGTPVDSGETWTNSSYQWLTDPDTGLAFALNDLSNMYLGLQLTNLGARGYTTQVYAVINYSAPASPSTWTLQDPLTVQNDLLVNAGTLSSGANTVTTANFTQVDGTFAAPSTNMYVSGDFFHTAGTFTYGTGTVNLNSTGADQNIIGSTHFNNLKINTTVARTINFDTDTTQTVHGLWTATGTDTANLTLTGSGNWNIDPQGGWSVNYVDVANSTNLATEPIDPAIRTDASLLANNVNWFYSVTTPSTVTIDSSIAGSTVTTTVGWVNNAVSATSFNVYTAPAQSNCSTAVYASNGSVSNPTTTKTIAGKSINTQYCAKVEAVINNSKSLPAYSAPTYTVAQTPGAPTFVGTPTMNTITVKIAPASNPSHTKFAIYNETTGSYVQADGSLGSSPAWATYDNWGGTAGKANVGLTPDTPYTYHLVAQNGDQILTEAGASASTRTSPNTHSLVYTAGANGTITGDLDQTVVDGDDATSVTAVPNTGYHFVRWSDDLAATPVILAARTDTNVTADLSVSAVFAINTYTLRYSANDNGSVTPSASTTQIVNYGADGATMTAVPATNYKFVSWSDGNLNASRKDTNIKADATYTATFALATYTITATAYTGGTISPSGVATVYGTDIKSYTITPNAGYFINDVEVNGDSEGGISNRTFSYITENQTINAYFAQPANPTNFTGVAGDKEATISWNNPTSTWFDHIEIYRSQVQGELGTLIEDNVTANSYNDSDLTNGENYYYTLKAVYDRPTANVSSGTAQLEIALGEVLPPNAPTNLRSTNIGCDNVSLAWSAPTDATGITGYQLFNADNNVSIASTADNSYDLEGLNSLIGYKFYVKSHNGAGELSGESNTLSVTLDKLGCEPVVSASLIMSGVPSSIDAGKPFPTNVKVMAIDNGGAVVTGYTGSVYFKVTDAKATIAANSSNKYTFSAADNGIHYFAGSGFTLQTAGNQKLTVTDGTVSSSATVKVIGAADVLVNAEDTVNNLFANLNTKGLSQRAAEVTTAAVAATAALLVAPLVLSSVIGASVVWPQVIYLMSHLMQLLGIRRKRQPWGTVFNSQTGQPIPYAIVKIFDAEYNRLLETAVTGSGGRFGFLVQKGKYYITVTKSGYTFPSTMPVGNFFDTIYSGGAIEPKDSDKTITMNIPMDPQTKLSRNYKLLVGAIKLNRFLVGLRLGLLAAGILLAIILLIVSYNIFYVLSLGFYIMIAVFEFLRTRRGRPYGVVTDIYGHPLDMTIVRIYEKRTNRLIETDVNDAEGRFKFLVNPGVYYITATKPDYVDFKSHIMYLEKEKTMVSVNIKMKKIDDQTPNK